MNCLDLGLGWIRRRQRTLAQGVLALFCLAWLQAAVVPCVMAHDGSTEAPPAVAVHDGHVAAGAHEHASSSGPGSDAHPCVYCPPDDAGGASCDDHGGCAYPHDPQVDARAGGILAALPAAAVVPTPYLVTVAPCTEGAAPDVVPRVPLSVSYCRFLE